MTDKERILIAIVTRVIPSLSCGLKLGSDVLLESSNLQHGDLVFANTTRLPNKFMVGFVEEVKEDEDCVVIREIGTKKLCNYYNQYFTKINKKKLGYEYLEGLQYKIYRKVLDSFEFTDYFTRFKSISFKENMCFVQAREAFKNDLLFEISFPYDNKTSVKSIVKILINKEKEIKEN